MLGCDEGALPEPTPYVTFTLHVQEHSKYRARPRHRAQVPSGPSTGGPRQRALKPYKPICKGPWSHAPSLKVQRTWQTKRSLSVHTRHPDIAAPDHLHDQRFCPVRLALCQLAAQRRLLPRERQRAALIMRCTQRAARDCSSHTMYNDHLRLCQTLDARSERFCVLEVIWSALDRSRRRLALPSSLHAQRGSSATCGPLDSTDERACGAYSASDACRRRAPRLDGAHKQAPKRVGT